jgi:hypothetical protein
MKHQVVLKGLVNEIVCRLVSRKGAGDVPWRASTVFAVDGNEARVPDEVFANDTVLVKIAVCRFSRSRVSSMLGPAARSLWAPTLDCFGFEVADHSSYAIPRRRVWL